MKVILESYGKLEMEETKDLVDELYRMRAEQMGSDTNPTDFASMSLKAMLRLQQAGKPNLVYKWCQCLEGVSGRSGQDLERMPFGMLEYIIQFYSCTNALKQVCQVYFAIFDKQ